MIHLDEILQPIHLTYLGFQIMSLIDNFMLCYVNIRELSVSKYVKIVWFQQLSD